MQLRGELFMSSDVFVSWMAWWSLLETRSVFVVDVHCFCTPDAPVQLSDVGPSLLRGYGKFLYLPGAWSLIDHDVALSNLFAKFCRQVERCIQWY
jgi:hypothetical protein